MPKSEAEHFLKAYRSAIVDGVRNVDNLVDFLIQEDVFSKEMGSAIRAQEPKQNQVRKLYEYLNSNKAHELMLRWLKEEEPDLIKDFVSPCFTCTHLGKRPKIEVDRPEISITFGARARGGMRLRGYRGALARGGMRLRGYRGALARGGMRLRGYRGAGARGGTRGIGYRGVTRGRGYRGAGARGGTRGRGYGGALARGGNEAAFRPEAGEEARLEAVRAEREKFLEKLTLEEFRELCKTQLEKQPNLVFDVLKMNQRRNDASPFERHPDLPWCKCGNCREMPTDIERKCCDQESDYCISRLQHFSHFCLDDELLGQDTKVQVAQTADDLKAYRNAAYGRFTAWKHGPLGRGNREVIPSCCVWRIRDKYPDPHGQYTGFIHSPQKYSPEKITPCRIKQPSFD